MIKEELENLCRREFSKINGLYQPSDVIEVYSTNPISIHYMSLQCADLSLCEDTDENRTRCIFIEEEFEGQLVGNIFKINLHPSLRRRGLGGKMVLTMEEIFRKRGLKKVLARDIENEDFWEKMGYSLRTIPTINPHIYNDYEIIGEK